MATTGRVVLVLEANEHVRGLLCRMVERCGHEPEPADGWGRAAPVCRARGAELAGAVLGLRGADGVDGPAALDALRRERPGLPAVFVCSVPDPYTVPGLLALGRTRVLPKPFTVAQYERVARELFGGG